MELSNRELWLLLHATRQRLDWLGRLKGSDHVTALEIEMAELHAKLIDERTSRDWPKPNWVPNGL